MAKVITFSRHFQKGHPLAGKETLFIEQFLNSVKPIENLNDIPQQLKGLLNDFFLIAGDMQKHHTIREGNRFKAGEYFSPRVWSAKPYRSPQIIICDDVLIKKVWDIEINNRGGAAWFEVVINGKIFAQLHHGHDIDKNAKGLKKLAKNDGLELEDFKAWFNQLPFKGQIICWNDEVDYNNVAVIEDVEDYEFQTCDNCDLPDACEDYGCAIKKGIAKPKFY